MNKFIREGGGWGEREGLGGRKGVRLREEKVAARLPSDPRRRRTVQCGPW